MVRKLEVGTESLFGVKILCCVCVWRFWQWQDKNNTCNLGIERKILFESVYSFNNKDHGKCLCVKRVRSKVFAYSLLSSRRTVYTFIDTGLFYPLIHLLRMSTGIFCLHVQHCVATRHSKTLVNSVPQYSCIASATLCFAQRETSTSYKTSFAMLSVRNLKVTRLTC